MPKKKLDGFDLLLRLERAEDSTMSVTQTSMFTKKVIAGYLKTGVIQEVYDNSNQLTGYRIGALGMKMLEYVNATPQRTDV